jgi:hypothetical protein
MHGISGTRPPEQIQNIRAAAEHNVLAVVDDFAHARMLIGGSASTDIRPSLEQLDRVAVLR